MKCVMKIIIENFRYKTKRLEQKFKKILHFEEPEFARYLPDTPFFEKTLRQYRKYKNLIVIGHGGSITSTQGIYGALKKEGKNLFIIDTPEPDFIFSIKKICMKKDTFVIIISKSSASKTTTSSGLKIFLSKSGISPHREPLSSSAVAAKTNSYPKIHFSSIRLFKTSMLQARLTLQSVEPKP